MKFFKKKVKISSTLDLCDIHSALIIINNAKLKYDFVSQKDNNLRSLHAGI